MAHVENEAVTPLEPVREAEAALKQLFLEVAALGSLLRQGALTEGHGVGLAGGESAILELLDRQGAQSVPQMARIRNTSRQNIQVAVNRLRREQSVEFSMNPAHKRSRLVQITESGRKRLAVADRQERQRLQGLAGQFRAAQLGTASSLLRSLRLGFAGEKSPHTRAASARSDEPIKSPAKVVLPQSAQPARVAEWEPASGELPVNLL